MSEQSVKSRVQVSNSLKLVLSFFVLAIIGVQAYRFYWPTAIISLAGNELTVQVADNTYRQEKGLGGRSDLKYDGMLFLFPKTAPYVLVMREMQFPIDIIWLSGGAVVDIAPNVPTEPGVAEEDLRRYAPRKPANMVLEVKAGWAQANGLKLGDTLQVKGD